MFFMYPFSIEHNSELSEHRELNCTFDVYLLPLQKYFETKMRRITKGAIDFYVGKQVCKRRINV